MKKLLFITLSFLAVPSFFMLTIYQEEDIIKEESPILEEVSYAYEPIYIKVKQISQNKIVEIDLEEYVKGVIAGEMPISINIEALKAQAVAARTYAVRRINKNNTYDVVDTVMNQVYIDNENLKAKWQSNYDAYMNKIKMAVEDTRGEYVDYNGTYADTLFFSTSTGNTENSEEIFGTKVSYLQSVDSYWDEEVSPAYQEKNIFTREQFCNLLNMNNCTRIYINILNETSTGRVKTVEINSKKFAGSEVAAKLGVKSNFFNIYIQNNQVIVETKGFGHGVGMSQYGAQGMAINGYTYKEILEHYYQGTTIKKLY